ncbi:MAG: hypothetical protein JW891_17055 [Candidatus Lokiarchaeota archaeon]|nr:hypothetical protein [Candidatus Lokiarchaeota archaeon]
MNETTLVLVRFTITMGLDHGDLTNFNSYEPTEPLIEKAIEFTPGVVIPV